MCRTRAFLGGYVSRILLERKIELYKLVSPEYKVLIKFMKFGRYYAWYDLVHCTPFVYILYAVQCMYQYSSSLMYFVHVYGVILTHVCLISYLSCLW